MVVDKAGGYWPVAELSSRQEAKAFPRLHPFRKILPLELRPDLTYGDLVDSSAHAPG